MNENRTETLWMDEDQLRAHCWVLMQLLQQAWAREFELRSALEETFLEGVAVGRSEAAVDVALSPVALPGCMLH